MEVTLTNGRIIITAPSSKVFEFLIQKGYKWSKAHRQLRADATLSALKLLEYVGAITPELKALKQRMEADLVAIQTEKLNPNPVPCVPAPVKATLYKHQIRAYNMALMAFGVLSKGENYDKQC